MPTQVELKVKAAENRFEEEKSKIQRNHEDALKQVYLLPFCTPILQQKMATFLYIVLSMYGANLLEIELASYLVKTGPCVPTH